MVGHRCGGNDCSNCSYGSLHWGARLIVCFRWIWFEQCVGFVTGKFIAREIFKLITILCVKELWCAVSLPGKEYDEHTLYFLSKWNSSWIQYNFCNLRLCDYVMNLYYIDEYHLKRIPQLDFIFYDYLLSSIHSLDNIRIVSKDNKGTCCWHCCLMIVILWYLLHLAELTCLPLMLIAPCLVDKVWNYWT